ncbi:QcrA and Rieske domain-containing protein [Candidatus Entotheonella palauensis]|uniref:QcrA and Rieske domain-containing protein n=1 Tax=Candidatus Entotheonella palauensis TaxID=93172 RepID=UPI0015C4800E|nr:Rieske (2Fe-2S) protein [Candidatus Entotheonella palauensis]
MSDECKACRCAAPRLERRTLFKTVLGGLMALPFADAAIAQGRSPAKARPRKGDRFVFALGERQDELVAPADVQPGATPVLTYPIDPQTQVIRNGSRINQVVLVRVDPEQIADNTRRYAADGIVAYSAFCTHRGCPVMGWQVETRMLKCPCHNSEFDPRDGARVILGPAKRRLAALPLHIVDGVLMAAGGFKGRLGMKPGY